MMAHVMVQLEYLIRILGASLCGFIVGLERENHLKTAGIRTHTIVALASAVMMIISKYGFMDVLTLNHIDLDPSRMAAATVSAVGFLGAGVIFTRNINVSGLTTAAGIWATVGVGMSFGAGMYVLGIMATICIMVAQFLLHRKFRWLKTPTFQQITLVMNNSENVKSILTDSFSIKDLKIITMKASRLDSDTLKIKLSVAFPDNYTYQDVIDLLKENPLIKSVDI